MTAAQVIRKEYGNAPNFMTPERLQFGFLREPENGYSVAYELSSGSGMSGDTIYGVSIVRAYPWGTRRMFNLSACFPSRALAMRAIANGRDKLGRSAHTD